MPTLLLSHFFGLFGDIWRVVTKKNNHPSTPPRLGQDSARHPAWHHPHIALRSTATDVPREWCYDTREHWLFTVWCLREPPLILRSFRIIPNKDDFTQKTQTKHSKDRVQGYEICVLEIYDADMYLQLANKRTWNLHAVPGPSPSRSALSPSSGWTHLLCRNWAVWDSSFNLGWWEAPP